MTGAYIQRGEALDYTNGGETKIAANEVVSLTTRIGIAGQEIAVGATGSLHVTGVFEFAKEASAAITLGAAVYYDATNSCITTTSTSNIPAGYAVEASAAAASKVKVKLLG